MFMFSQRGIYEPAPRFSQPITNEQVMHNQQLELAATNLNTIETRPFPNIFKMKFQEVPRVEVGFFKPTTKVTTINSFHSPKAR